MNNSLKEYNIKINKSKTVILMCAKQPLNLEHNNWKPKVRNRKMFRYTGGVKLQMIKKRDRH